ncbi:hypothetical protein [Pseudomonas asplenii]|uniref:Uncharacterized protein n=1 Tax=Pseudomonas asplenii TaxID=53407 RepID=A0A1H6NMT9_9PSED|nr:hypothetical protein [Pseudomonas fuscovaginae]SEI17220.1 hypothetical protein SAMN05216581_3333 [Pseudomonas fuscovaginae]
MKCPNCEHIPEPGETEDHSRCPKCHVFYHKSLAKRLELAEATNQQQAEELRNARAAHEIRGKYIEELKQSTEKPKPVVSYQVKEGLGEYQGATPVVVLDFKMNFYSMIWFMVKLSIASIPALIIVKLATVIVGVLTGGMFSLI